jgi:hypothetical protein
VRGRAPPGRVAGRLPEHPRPLLGRDHRVRHTPLPRAPGRLARDRHQDRLDERRRGGGEPGGLRPRRYERVRRAQARERRDHGLGRAGAPLARARGSRSPVGARPPGVATRGGLQGRLSRHRWRRPMAGGGAAQIRERWPERATSRRAGPAPAAAPFRNPGDTRPELRDRIGLAVRRAPSHRIVLPVESGGA